MKVRSTYLRQHLFVLLDRVLNTGNPIEIERRGKKLLIVNPGKNSKLLNLKERKRNLKEDPNFYTHIDWSLEWKHSK